LGRGHLESNGTDLPLLVRALTQQLGRSVADKTGLKGSYDYTLKWTPDDEAANANNLAEAANANNSSGPSLFTAVQEQLGLKLESDKARRT